MDLFVFESLLLNRDTEVIRKITGFSIDKIYKIYRNVRKVLLVCDYMPRHEIPTLVRNDKLVRDRRREKLWVDVLNGYRVDVCGK